MTKLLDKLLLLEVQAKEYGFYWPDFASVMAQVRSECDEVEELINDQTSTKARLKEEVGDLLHAVFSLCTYCELNPETTLSNAIDKFEKRFMLTKKFAEEDGNQNLHGKSMEEMMKYWNKAKTQGD